MATHAKLIVLLVVSAGFVWVSRRSLCNIRSHGFYRFFVWESILVLILINLSNWFYKPFSVYQIISWLLFIISLFLILHSYHLLVRIGKPSSKRKDPSLFGLEKTTELVTEGVYRYIRHPVYSSLLFLAWGVFFKNPSYIGIFLVGIATFFLIITAKMEEVENIKYFGDEYIAYMKHTKMFIPYIF
jgi:protein-S-isoprenylcysteine O-methyltransferase Ste14